MKSPSKSPYILYTPERSNRIEPFEVEMSIVGPPLPIFPSMRRFVVVAPSPVSGNSFVIELFDVAAATRAFVAGGRRTVTPPFEVLTRRSLSSRFFTVNSIPPFVVVNRCVLSAGVSAKVATIEPFEVAASNDPKASSTLIRPFEVRATTGPLTVRISIDPFDVDTSRLPLC